MTPIQLKTLTIDWNDNIQLLSILENNRSVHCSRNRTINVETRLWWPRYGIMSLHRSLIVMKCAWCILSIFFINSSLLHVSFSFRFIPWPFLKELYWEVIGSWCFPQKTKLSDNFWFAMTPFDWVSIGYICKCSFKKAILLMISLFIPLYRYVMSTNFTLQMGTRITNPGVARIR